MLARWW